MRTTLTILTLFLTLNCVLSQKDSVNYFQFNSDNTISIEALSDSNRYIVIDKIINDTINDCLMFNHKKYFTILDEACKFELGEINLYLNTKIDFRATDYNELKTAYHVLILFDSIGNFDNYFISKNIYGNDSLELKILSEIKITEGNWSPAVLNSNKVPSYGIYTITKQEIIKYEKRKCIFRKRRKKYW